MTSVRLPDPSEHETPLRSPRAETREWPKEVILPLPEIAHNPRCEGWRGLVSCSSRPSHPALLSARPRRPAARLDQADEADDPNIGLAVQRESHGDGLHVEMLCARGRRNLQRYEPDSVEGVARPLVSAASRLISTLFSRQYSARLWRIRVS